MNQFFSVLYYIAALSNTRSFESGRQKDQTDGNTVQTMMSQVPIFYSDPLVLWLSYIPMVSGFGLCMWSFVGGCWFLGGLPLFVFGLAIFVLCTHTLPQKTFVGRQSLCNSHFPSTP